MSRADIIQGRILQIEDRLHQIAVELNEIKGPHYGPRLIGLLLDLSRRPALEKERESLIEQRRKLEREYDALPDSVKSY